MKRAIGVVLDEAPKVLEAETRHFSADARKRADAYAQLIKAAHDLRDAGVSIPKVQFAPRETEQAQRDRRHVFAMVYKALGEAEKAKIGRTDESLGIQIVCNLLAELGWGEITPEALSRMMKREAARPKPWYLVKVRAVTSKMGTKRSPSCPFFSLHWFGMSVFTQIWTDQMTDMTPKYATIPDWQRISGMRRTSTYEALGRGDLRSIKLGTRVLIDVEAGLGWLALLPPADIRPGNRKAA